MVITIINLHLAWLLLLHQYNYKSPIAVFSMHHLYCEVGFLLHPSALSCGLPDLAHYHITTVPFSLSTFLSLSLQTVPSVPQTLFFFLCLVPWFHLDYLHGFWTSLGLGLQAYKWRLFVLVFSNYIFFLFFLRVLDWQTDHVVSFSFHVRPPNSLIVSYSVPSMTQWLIFRCNLHGVWPITVNSQEFFHCSLVISPSWKEMPTNYINDW